MNNVNHLLWTGGWDSTFRLLQLTFEEKQVVQPHYIVRAEECTGKEINTINDICRKLSRKYPEQSKLILPVQYINMNSIEPNTHITKEYEDLVKSKRISIQYEIFARYCNQIGVSSMELSILNRENFEYFISNVSFFKYFDFPLLGLTKSEIEEMAKENEWMEIMRLTGFCRRPKNGSPCGFCGPCTDAVIGGLGWRLPIRARIIAYIQLPFRKWWRKNYRKQEKGILKYIPKLFKDKF